MPSDLLTQALNDWRSGRAYVDNSGNYRLRTERTYRGGKLTWTGKGKLAPWNRVAKREYRDSMELHRAAVGANG